MLNGSKIHQFFILLTYALAAFPILTYGIRTIFTVLWFILALVCYFYSRNGFHMDLDTRFNRNIGLHLLFSILPFLILVASLIYTNNIHEGVKNLIQMLTLLVLPLGFFLVSISGNFDWSNIKVVQIVFVTSVIILVAFQVIHVLFNLNYLLGDLTVIELKANGLINSETLSNQAVNTIKLRRFRKFVSGIVDTHPTYQSLWIVFSVFILVKRLLSIHRLKKILLYVFLIIFLLGWMFLISSRMPFIAGSIATIFIVFMGTLSLNKKILIVLSVLLFSLLSYLYVDTIKVRVNQVFDSGFAIIKKEDKAKDFNSINIRNGIYYCGLQIAIDNPIIGVGIGDTQQLLTECLINQVNSKIYSWHKYNSHNQYLAYMLDSGIIGLSFFVISLSLAFYISIRNREMDYLFFITLSSLVFLTENVLVRNDGILFYALFNSLFLFIRNKDSFLKIIKI